MAESTIPKPSNEFDPTPFAGRWIPWREIEACFWPGVGKRAERVNPELAPVRGVGGVYLLAWSKSTPSTIHPQAAEVKYIGETAEFRSRMAALGRSAGFWGERQDGHSGAWRWPKGANENLWIAFFPLGTNLPAHLAQGLRKWMEAVALEEHRAQHGRLPQVNAGKGEVVFEA